MPSPVLPEPVMPTSRRGWSGRRGQGPVASASRWCPMKSSCGSMPVMGSLPPVDGRAYARGAPTYPIGVRTECRSGSVVVHHVVDTEEPPTRLGCRSSSPEVAPMAEVHRPRLNVFGRQLLVNCITGEGSPWPRPLRPPASVGPPLNWLRRYRADGAGRSPRPQLRPHHSPQHLSHEAEQRMIRTRSAAASATPPGTHSWAIPLDDRQGPRAPRLQSARRCRKPTGVPIRYEREYLGELVHQDHKKLGRVPRGGGHRVHRRAAAMVTTGATATTTSRSSSTMPPGSLAWSMSLMSRAPVPPGPSWKPRSLRQQVPHRTGADRRWVPA